MFFMRSKQTLKFTLTFNLLKNTLTVKNKETITLLLLIDVIHK